MATQLSNVTRWIRDFEAVRRNASGLAGNEGRLLLKIGISPIATVTVGDCQVELTSQTPVSPAPNGTAEFADPEALLDVMTCKLNPMVAALQGRLQISGNLFFATKTLLGLRVDSPFSVPESAKEGEHAN